MKIWRDKTRQDCTLCSLGEQGCSLKFCLHCTTRTYTLFSRRVQIVVYFKFSVLSKILKGTPCYFFIYRYVKHPNFNPHLSRVVRKPDFAYAKTKTQIRFAVTAKLISAFVFATRIVQTLYFLNPKFQDSRYFLWLHSPVCVRPGRKPRRPVFSQRGSFKDNRLWNKMSAPSQ